MINFMRETVSLERILEDFGHNVSGKAADRRPITLWLLPEDKARYDRLQKASRREFCKKAREALLALMALAEDKTA